MYKIFIALLVGVTIGAYIHTYTRPPLQVVELASELWCFHSEHIDMDSFESSDKPDQSFIHFEGKKVRVYTPC